jgi:hypothetical protein
MIVYFASTTTFAAPIAFCLEVPTHEAGDWKEIGATPHHHMLESVLGRLIVMSFPISSIATILNILSCIFTSSACYIQ